MDKRSLYYRLNPELRYLTRRLYFLPTDFVDKLTGKRDSLTPPKGKIFVGHGDFKRQGNQFVEQLKTYGGLKAEHRVLDIGCGIGRVAVPLTQFLNEHGSYEGFDVVKSGIKWCQQKISKNYPNFNFQHIDLRNDLYNLKTKDEAKSFVFPYMDNEFDLVFLFSVFSHMMPEDVDNYLNQIQRVLKPGGTCLATFFIINNQSRALMENKNGLKFNYNKGDYALLDEKVKEANVAYNERYLKNIINKNDLKIENIHFGFWSGRNKSDCVDFQDIVISTLTS
ncbi:MAG: methyltransferase domain-containing protein [Bacteroidetes bacterium]|jgi:SAM-dependent methyltransferase|nr:methyltransferase domain-containing protein [Bacteroidota bacterium]